MLNASSSREHGPSKVPTASRIYDASLLYDLAFSYRDISAESDALSTWYRRVSGSEPLRSVLELASGPCAHALELAARGIRATGIDCSAEMCEYAERKARDLGLAREIDIRCADMIDFELSEPHDLAILMLNSVGHIYSLAAFTKHLRSVARSLAPNGVYVIEMQHPGNFLGRAARPAGVAVAKPWRIRRGELQLQVTWGTEDDPYDPIAQVFNHRVEMRLWDASGAEQVLVERCPMRDWTATELEAALELSEVFEIAEMHGSFAVDSAFDSSPESWRMIAVLRKRAI